MSTNEEKVIIDPNKTNENEDEDKDKTGADQDEDESEEGAEDKGDKPDKPTESLEDRRARLLRQLKQVDKKLGTSTEDKPAKTSKKSDGFDYGEKAYLTSNGIKGSDEHEFTLKLQKQTGLDLDSLMEDTYFQSKLSEFRETRATANATPSGTKRSNNSSVDTVEYWIAKGELPPVTETELRRKIVNARLKKDQTKGVFYNS
jgi:hypothetical protein